jgi:hypothetical protein
MGKYFLVQQRIMRVIMNTNYEYLIFHEELRKLKKDFQRCEDVRIKRTIAEDIELLENALQSI